jgi:hypothetical protein
MVKGQKKVPGGQRTGKKGKKRGPRLIWRDNVVSDLRNMDVNR